MTEIVLDEYYLIPKKTLLEFESLLYDLEIYSFERHVSDGMLMYKISRIKEIKDIMLNKNKSKKENISDNEIKGYNK